MLAIERTMLALLAAGRSERFGEVGSKLDEEFLGRPLGLHAVTALDELPFGERIAVTGRAGIDYTALGFGVIKNPDPHLGLAQSVKLAAARSKESGAEALLLALADMPRVTAAHVRRLFDGSADAMSVVASSDGHAPKPPALFGRGRFEALLALSGDAGARDLLRGGRHVIASPAELIDIDTPADLEALRRIVRPKR